jgi:hypothetical protein
VKCRVFLTDEGYGPLVRFAAILLRLREVLPELEVEIQTCNHVEALPGIVAGVTARKRHNMICWHKRSDGSPDLDAIRQYYASYEVKSRDFVSSHVESDDKPDFIISDFVYEAFEIAHLQGIPSFGIAHFTWDWFFSKLYPNPIPYSLRDRWKMQADLATRIFFPAFTPPEIPPCHHNCTSVSLVVRPVEPCRPLDYQGRSKKILVVDSGSMVLHQQLRAALSRLRPLHGWTVIVREDLVTGTPDGVQLVPLDQMFIELIPHVDLVIGRAGFNTISECLASRVPMLLLGEALNPEMAENILAMKSKNLASFVDMGTLVDDFTGTVERFLLGEYAAIRSAVEQHSIKHHGAGEIASMIARHVAARDSLV